MDNQKNKTVFQRLNSILMGDDLYSPSYQENNNGVSHFDDINPSNPIDALTAEQNKYLRNQTSKVSSSKFQRHTYYEYHRPIVYFELEQMEFTPEIATALDIYSEEACTEDESGRVLHIKSNNGRIKVVLEDLFYERLRVEDYLVNWTRDLCKYGEIFLHRGLDLEKGVVSLQPLPGVEMNIDMGEMSGNLRLNEKKKMTYYHEMTGIKFTPIEMSHIKLMGDTRYYPYGVSMLDKSRRIWNQLRLAEDAMLIYRAVRAPERRVFKVDVGNVDPDDVMSVVQEFKNSFKRDMIVDPKTGNIDFRAKFLNLQDDYFIPVRGSVQGAVIDTLPGASNLDAIADIEYLQGKLLASLRIPKAFLNFSESAGGQGKNLAFEDYRFSRTVSSKIQRSMIAGLNEVAKVHLFLLGFPEEEIGNFKLMLNNPSTQPEMTRLDVLERQANLYGTLTGRGAGIAPMSHTKVKMELFGMTEDEIIEDLNRQRVEAAVEAELTNTGQIIKSTGIFDRVDSKFKTVEGGASGSTENQLSPEFSGGGGFGGDLGMGGFTPSGGAGGGGGMDMGGLDMGGGALGGMETTTPDVGATETETPPTTEELPESYSPRKKYKKFLDDESPSVEKLKGMLRDKKPMKSEYENGLKVLKENDDVLERILTGSREVIDLGGIMESLIEDFKEKTKE